MHRVTNVDKQEPISTDWYGGPEGSPIQIKNVAANEIGCCKQNRVATNKIKFLQIK